MLRDIDGLIERLTRSHPGIRVEQLRVAHPGADDDGIWFVTHPDGRGEVQLETTTGALPFLVEGDDSPARDTARTIESAAALVVRRLGLDDRTG